MSYSNAIKLCDRTCLFEPGLLARHRLASRADDLGELLGEEHDLMLLAERVRVYEPLKRRRKRTRKRLLRAISRRRASLRKRALRDGERLYARKPGRFVRNMRA